MEQQDLQKRLLLAFVLSFLIFMVFDLVVPKPENHDLNGMSRVEESTASDVSRETPKVAQVEEPKLIGNSKISSPSGANGTALVYVKSNRFIYTIDNIGRISQVKLLEDKYMYEGRELELLNPNQ